MFLLGHYIYVYILLHVINDVLCALIAGKPEVLIEVLDSLIGMSLFCGAH